MQYSIPLQDVEAILKDYESRLNPQESVSTVEAIQAKVDRALALRIVYEAIAIAQGKTLALVNQERGGLLPEQYLSMSGGILATIPDYVAIGKDEKLWLVYIENDGNEFIYGFNQEDSPSTEQIQVKAEAEGIEIESQEQWEALVEDGYLDGDGDIKLSFFGPYTADELFG